MINKNINYLSIGFLIGAAVIGLINMILNIEHAIQNSVLMYDYLMVGVAIIGLIINILLRMSEHAKRERKMEKTKQYYNLSAIGFLLGLAVISLINMILNLEHAIQGSILTYNYILVGVSVFGLILNIMIVVRSSKRS
jgi:drug/metabolite transporter (DMT)-like permease